MSHNSNLKAPSRPKINARHGIMTGQPGGTTFMPKPHDLSAGNSDSGKKISARTGVMTQEPNGTTFTEHDRLETKHWPVHMKQPEGSKWEHGQTKKPDRFGVMKDEPNGTTFQGAQKALFDLPDASKAPLRGIKTITETTGLYVPAKSGPVNMAGEVPTGKSAKKKGATDKGDSKDFAKD
jgi:hypothetical protein